jgi:sec-independent protein translocase protein TatA
VEIPYSEETVVPNIGPLEIGIVLVIVLVIFGPKRLPDLGHSLGKGIREFKGSIGGESDDDEKPAAIAPAATTPAPSPREHQGA